MKRFFLIVSLAVCLSLMFAHSAFAIYAVEYESKTVSQGQTGVTVKLKVFSDLTYSQVTVPTVVRTLTNASFWTGALPYDTTQQGGVAVGIAWTWQSGSPWPSFFQTVRPGVPTGECGIEGDTGYDGVSPDHFQMTGQGVSDTEAAAPTGWDVLTLTFDVNTSVGTFEFDTACFTTSLNKIFIIASDYTDHGPGGPGWDHFTPGIITIEENECPSDPGAYPGLVAGNELANLQNAHGGTYTDKEGDDARFYMVAGPGAVGELSGLWTWTPQCGDDGPYTVEIEVADAAHAGGGSCNPGAPLANNVISFQVQVAAIPVGIQCPANQSVHWGANVMAQVTATTPCTPVGFLQTGGPGMTTGAGAYTWLTTCQDLGVHPVNEMATDNAQRTDNCMFTVTVTNTLPVCNIPVPMPFLYLMGHHQDLALHVNDADGDNLTFFGLTVTPPVLGNPPTLTIAGQLDWDVDAIDAPGSYTIGFWVSDGCQEVYCEKYLEVLYAEAYKISILQPFPTDLDPNINDHYLHELNGRRVTMGVYMEKGFTQGSGAFDFLICYDQSVLSFIEGEKGPGIADWEYFTYRYGPFGNNCGTGCPSGFIRLIAYRDMNNGVAAPALSEFVDGYVAYLTFYLSEDRSLIGLCAMIGFCSIDCGDNTISDKSGDSLALPYWGQNGPDTLIIFGPDYNWEECLQGDKWWPMPYIWFDPGWICVKPPPDDRGDINLNGIANEVGDATLYSNYFIHGAGVLHDDPPPDYFENRVLASDVNDDGIVLTVADLVYLIRIITGDAQPFPESGEGDYDPKLNPYSSALEVSSEMVDGQMVITTNSSSDLGAGHLVFRYTGLTMGTLETTTNMTVGSNAANGELNVLVFSMKGENVEAGTNELVSIPTDGNGMIELVDASFSDAGGSLMTVNMHRVAPPTSFELMQNYPNPFNASTMIRFALPVASDWSMKIYNVAGQAVKTFDGSSAAGYVSVAWNADVASGIYFYKLTAGDFTATKKMVLMK